MEKKQDVNIIPLKDEFNNIIGYEIFDILTGDRVILTKPDLEKLLFDILKELGYTDKQIKILEMANILGFSQRRYANI
jgi:hypothetical protein